MTSNNLWRQAVGCLTLAGVTLSVVGAAGAGTAASPSSPVRLLGNGVGTVRFGTAQSLAVHELTNLFGTLKTTSLKATDFCGLTAQSTGSDVLFNFVGAKLAGYEVGNASGKPARQPNVATAAGLRLGDTVAQAKKIYGPRFITSADQGGSWKVKTLTGEVLGLLVKPPMAGPGDQVDVIGAGDFGCPAMGL